MGNFLTFLSDSSNTNVIALSALIVTWIIYRWNTWIQRQSILKSISNEMKLHGNWVGTEYFDNVIPKKSDWHLKSYVVFKLSTVAIDNGISQGAGLFLNKNIVPALTNYRQSVNQFNQLVDLAMMYQSNVELWNGKTSKRVANRMEALTQQIHWYGISNKKQAYAHYYFRELQGAVQNERNSKVIPIIWAITGINLFWIRGLMGIVGTYL